MHHHREHRTQHWNAWRNLLYLWTALIALIVHRATGLGLFAAIVIGFLIAAALIGCAYLAIHGHNSKGPGAE